MQDILKQARIFAIKVAMIQNLLSTDLDFLDPQEQKYVKDMGKTWDNPMNPPPFITDKDIWKRAKRAAKKRWKKYDEPYAIVLHIYENMGGGFKKKKKKS